MLCSIFLNKERKKKLDKKYKAYVKSNGKTYGVTWFMDFVEIKPRKWFF